MTTTLERPIGTKGGRTDWSDVDPGPYLIVNGTYFQDVIVEHEASDGLRLRGRAPWEVPVGHGQLVGRGSGREWTRRWPTGMPDGVILKGSIVVVGFGSEVAAAS